MFPVAKKMAHQKPQTSTVGSFPVPGQVTHRRRLTAADILDPLPADVLFSLHDAVEVVAPIFKFIRVLHVDAKNLVVGSPGVVLAAFANSRRGSVIDIFRKMDECFVRLCPEVGWVWQRKPSSVLALKPTTFCVFMAATHIDVCEIVRRGLSSLQEANRRATGSMTDVRLRACGTCGSFKAPVPCTGCNKLLYCDITCRSFHWADHIDLCNI